MPEFGQNLPAQRRKAIEAANVAIGQVRRAYITAIPGQEMIYAAKEAEAQAYISQEPENLADFPMLAAEVGITAPTAYHLAMVWLHMGAYWRHMAATLEKIRLGAIAKIEAASSADEISAVLNVMRDEIDAHASIAALT